MLDRCQQYGDLRLLEVTEERNGPSGLRDDDDDVSHAIQNNINELIHGGIMLTPCCNTLHNYLTHYI